MLSNYFRFRRSEFRFQLGDASLGSVSGIPTIGRAN
jgi:hypothetical protein